MSSQVLEALKDALRFIREVPISEWAFPNTYDWRNRLTKELTQLIASLEDEKSEIPKLR